MVQKRPPIQGLSYRLFNRILRCFKKKPFIINPNRTIADRAIFISNHSAASGPITLSVYFPKLFIPWGVHDMCEGYYTRWQYLYHVFYQQKLHYGKFRSFIIATLFGIISRIFYRSMRVIPTYRDIKMAHTIRLSIKYLDYSWPVLVFPEDSSSGYHEELTLFNPGFVFLALQYYQKTKIDLPIYTIYYSKKDQAMIIDEPQYIQPLVKQGMDKYAIAEHFKNRTNQLRLEMLEKIQ